MAHVANVLGLVGLRLEGVDGSEMEEERVTGVCLYRDSEEVIYVWFGGQAKQQASARRGRESNMRAVAAAALLLRGA